MKTLTFTLTFLTAAFLGDAEQSGRWRTPPIKHLLREWWRVAYVADRNFNVDVEAMRREEGLLFGHAWLEDDTVERNGRQEKTAARKSLVRLRLDRWEAGTLRKEQWPWDTTVHHPEVPKPIGGALYLGYGPLEFKAGTQLKANAAIQVAEMATFSIAYPTAHVDPMLDRLVKENAPRIQRALWLMERYGTLGGRSRNGWGSFSLLPLPLGEGRGQGMTPPLRPWRDCLKLDWPNAIGKDDRGPLIWQTKPLDDWKAVMRELAIIKIGLRTQFVFPEVAPPHRHPLERHWLSYPITRHPTRAFDRNARLPNCLRFKVRQTSDGKLVGVIFHVPCLPPHDFNPQCNAIVQTWQSVHTLLDELTMPTGARSYPCIKDGTRRAKLKPQLDMVTLKRIPE